MTSQQGSDPAAAAALRAGSGSAAMTNDPNQTPPAAGDAAGGAGAAAGPARSVATAAMEAEKVLCRACNKAVKEGERLIRHQMGRRSPEWIHENGTCEHQAIKVEDHPESPALPA